VGADRPSALRHDECVAGSVPRLRFILHLSMGWLGIVKLASITRGRPSMSAFPSGFSRHTSPHPTQGRSAFSTLGGEQLVAGGAQPERDSGRARAPIRIAARAWRT
jgi:hypothetical protein